MRHSLTLAAALTALLGCSDDATTAMDADVTGPPDAAEADAAPPPPDFDCPEEPPPSAVPYEDRFLEVLGAQMHYYESGPADGPVVLLLHGLPVSAYFWRNVIPFLDGEHRVIALDHIGFGQSDRPAGLDYGLEDQVRYLDGFVAALGLSDMVVVGQDMGSWVGMTWASRNPEQVRAVALVEGIIPPLLPASAETLDPNLLGIWLAARDPAMAQQMFVEEHFFLNAVLPGFTACPMRPETLATYAAPWEDPASRAILFATPAEIPIDGEPPEHVAAVQGYVDWIESSPVPKLLVHASPGALMPAATIEAATARMPNVTAVNIGPGIHFLAESKPTEVGMALRDWLVALPEP